MTSQSGYLNCFLKFLNREEGETLLTPIRRGRGRLYPSRRPTNEVTLPVENSKRKRGRPRKTPKVKDKIEKEKFHSDSDDVASSAEITTEVEGSDTMDSDSQSRCHEKDTENKFVKEGSNKCVNVEGCEENNSVKGLDEENNSVKGFDEENNSVKGVDEENNSVKGADEDNNRDSSSEEKMEKQSIEGLIEDQDAGAEVKKDNHRMRPDQRKNIIDEENECGEREKKDFVISNVNTSSWTDENEDISQDSTTDITLEEGGNRGKKRKNKSDIEENTPRRALSSRKAKEKLKFSYIDSESEDNPGFDEESDSDNDPVWVPNEKDPSDEEDCFGWPGGQAPNLIKKVRCNSPVTVDAKQNEEKRGKSGAEPDEKKTETLKNSTNKECQSELKGNTENGTNVENTPKTVKPEKKDFHYQQLTQMPFQSGSFIALKKELEDLEEPTIWRVDGKALLQKYEPFRGEDGCLKYRNVSTYSGWGPKNSKLYQPVPVRFILQNRFEIIVEILQDELIINEDKLREKLVKDSEKHSYAYEVYLQTLVSQALDTNFLSEIVAEKDEYFITSMDEMDNVCEEKKKKLLQVFEWPEQLKESLCTWPKLNIKLKVQKSPDTNCQLCCKFSYFAEVDLEGDVYCNKTLEHSSPNPDAHKFKTFSACKTCADNAELFNKIAHLKYHTYNECVKLVSEKQASDTSKDNTTILHDILADSQYIAKKFQEVCLLWAQADLKSRKKKPEKPEEITL